jgi:hypothetical protein
VRVFRREFGLDSEKRRSPAWCDRILRFKNPLKVKDGEWAKQQLYTSCMTLQSSDHKPVVSLYQLKVNFSKWGSWKLLKRVLDRSDESMISNSKKPLTNSHANSTPLRTSLFQVWMW